MKWFENLRISVKLVASLLIITGFTVVVGIVGLSGMRQVDNSIENVVGQSRSLFYLAGANDTLQRARISVRDMVLGAVTEGEEQVKSAFAAISANMDIIENHFNAFCESNHETYIQNAFDLGRALYENELIPIILAIYNASLEGDLDRAFSLLEECVEVSDNIISFFDHGIELGLRYSTNITNAAHDLTNRSFLLIAVMLSVSLACSLLLAFYISSMITRNLKALKRFADDISNGNLNPNFPSVPNDEIGMLAYSFDVMSKEIFRVLEIIRQKSGAVVCGNL